MGTIWNGTEGRSADRLIIGATALAVLSCPVFAATPETWPGLVGLSFVATGGLVLIWRRDPVTTEQVLWGALLLRLAFLPLLPGLTDDLYRYVWDGWLQLEGINPYRFPPEHEALQSFQEAPIYDRLNSQPYYSVYPPLTQLAFAIGGWAYTEMGWRAAYYTLKVLFTGAEFGGVILLSRLTSARNLLLYAWNPLVLIEIAGQGHTEALLIPCLLGLVWAVKQGKGRWASLAVSGAGMIKLYPFVLWPLLLRRYGFTAVWPGAAFIIIISLPYAAPYALPHLKASVDLFAYLMEFNAGPYYLTKHLLWWVTGADWSKVIGPTFRYIFLSSLPLVYALDWRRDWPFRRTCLLILGLYIALSTTVHPWYLVPILALSVIPHYPTWPWFWLGGLSIGTYLFYVDGPYWIWIVVGWGGAAAMGTWLYGSSLYRQFSGVRADVAQMLHAGESAPWTDSR